MSLILEYCTNQVLEDFSHHDASNFWTEHSYKEDCDDIENAVKNCEISQELVSLHNELFPPRGYSPLSYNLLLALAILVNPKRDFDLWDFIKGTMGYKPQQYPLLDDMVSGVFTYFSKHIRPTLKYRYPTNNEMLVLLELQTVANDIFDRFPDKNDLLREMTLSVYEVGKKNYGTEKNELIRFFQMFYELMLGQPSGPRLPIFIAHCGRERFNQMVDGVLNESWHQFYLRQRTKV